MVGPQGIDEMNERELLKVEKSVHAKGHSTAVDAAKYAKEVGAKMLVLNHISNRYDFLDEEHYINAVQQMKELAVVGIENRCNHRKISNHLTSIYPMT